MSTAYLYVTGSTAFDIVKLNSAKNNDSSSSLLFKEELGMHIEDTSTNHSSFNDSIFTDGNYVFGEELMRCITDTDGEQEETPRVTTPVAEQDRDTQLFRFLQPFPVPPPTYEDVNANRRVTFPIFENIKKCNINDLPPSYNPSIDNFTVVSMKQEFITPYKENPVPTWRNYIMELNSTQLNFYEISNDLTACISGYSNSPIVDATTIGDDSNKETNKDKSKSSDQNYFKFGSLFSSVPKGTYHFNRIDQMRIFNEVNCHKPKYLTYKNLFRSYSLQFGKVGLPTDLPHMINGLRMRLEGEQILLNFSHIDDTIIWIMYLQIGIGISLDLDLRDLPDYRVIPRRSRQDTNNELSRRASVTSSVISANSTPSGRARNNTISSISSNSTTNSLFTNSNNGIPASKITNEQTRSRNNSLQHSISSIPLSDNYSRRSSVDSQFQNSSLKSKLKTLFKTGTENSLRKHHSENTQIKITVYDNDTTTELPYLRPISSAAYFRRNSNTIDPCQTSTHHSYSDPNDENDLDNLILSNSYGTNEKLQLHQTRQNYLSSLNHYNFVNDPNINLMHSTSRNRTNSTFTNEIAEETKEITGTDALAPHNMKNNNNVLFFEEANSQSETQFSIYSNNEELDRSHARTCSITSTLSYMLYEDEEFKWNPHVPYVAKTRFIRNALRCVKPLTSETRWVGKAICRSTSEPPFSPNNMVQIRYGLNEKSDISNNGTIAVDPLDNTSRYGDQKTKNHFLKAFIVGYTELKPSLDKLYNRKK